MPILVSASDLGSKFTSDDIIGGSGHLNEDCAVLKGNDGKFYWFFDDFTGYTNHDVYCVQSDYADFHTYTNKGKILTRANMRVMAVIYDSAASEYVLYIDDAANSNTRAFYIAEADFPNGTWIDAGVVLDKGSTGAWDDAVADVRTVWKEGSTWMMMYAGKHNSTLALGKASSSNPRGTFTKDGSNPFWYHSDAIITWGTEKSFRGTYPYLGGYIIFIEGHLGSGFWKVGCVYIDSTFHYVSELAGSPLLVDASRSYANPNTALVDGSTVYLYCGKSKTGGTYGDFYNNHVIQVTVTGSITSEDFTTYTKVDPASYITKVARHMSITTRRNLDIYLYKDKGVGHFSSDFDHMVDFYISTNVTNYVAWVHGIANTVDDLGYIETHVDLLGVRIDRANSVSRALLWESVAGTEYYANSGNILNANTWYYLRIKRNESIGTYGTLYCGIYSTSALRNAGNAQNGDIANLSLTLHQKQDFRYIYAGSSYNDGAGVYEATLYVEHLDLQEIAGHRKSSFFKMF